MKIDHVQLAMPIGRESEARHFFINILGMIEEEKPEPLASRGGCWFRKAEAIIHVGVEKEFVPQCKAHPAILVTDLQAVAQTLEAHQFDVLWDEALPNRQRFYTSDPFGNRIEFLQDGHGFSQQ